MRKKIIQLNYSETSSTSYYQAHKYSKMHLKEFLMLHFSLSAAIAQQAPHIPKGNGECLPPRLSNRLWEQGKKDALPATMGTAWWDLNPSSPGSRPSPRRDESPACVSAELTSSGGDFTSHPLFLRAKPSQSPTLLKIILYATFAWGANLSPRHIPVLQSHQILI